MKIRSYKPADIRQISLLYFNTIRRVNARDYTAQQIRAWAPGIPDNAFWSNRFLTRAVFVAELGDKIIGFAEFEKSGHVDCFYVHHEHIRQGVGSALMTKLEDEARAANVHRLFAEVSITAKGFFEKKGFVVKEERTTEYHAVEFQLYLMERFLGLQF